MSQVNGSPLATSIVRGPSPASDGAMVKVMYTIVPPESLRRSMLVVPSESPSMPSRDSPTKAGVDPGSDRMDSLPASSAAGEPSPTLIIAVSPEASAGEAMLATEKTNSVVPAGMSQVNGSPLATSIERGPSPDSFSGLYTKTGPEL